MIFTKIFGGLGNQLFQYTAGRYLANKHKTDLKIFDDKWFENSNSPLAYYRLNQFNIQENFASEEEIKNLQAFQETRTSFIPEVLDLPDNIVLKGYWHSWKYFAGIRDILLKEISLKNPMGKNSSQWKEKIVSAECSVSVHVRRGDYILFLNENDFIISNATSVIAQILSLLYKNDIGHFFDKGQKSISYENFILKYSPNIFCFTENILENVDGDITIDGIENKKFSVQTDVIFKDLKEVKESNITDSDKLILLASKQINNYLGTKIFKRSFLNKNKIRFDENLSEESAELKFLVDTFMHTKNISFVPQVFYGKLNVANS